MTDVRQASVWTPPVSFLPRVLLEPRRPLLTLAVAWATAFLPTLALAALSSTLLPEAQPKFPLGNENVFWLIVIAAPLLETVFMGLALILLASVFAPTLSVLISAVGWGIAHSTIAPAWGLVIWWPFLVFSTVFLTWRERSVPAAVAMAAATHALHNLVPALMLVAGLPR